MKKNLVIAAATLAVSFGVGMLLHRKIDNNTDLRGVLGFEPIDLRI